MFRQSNILTKFDWLLFQSAPGITKCDGFLLQIASGSMKCVTDYYEKLHA